MIRNLWLQRTFQKSIATKLLEINQDYVRKGTAKAISSLMSFARITCNILT